MRAGAAGLASVRTDSPSLPRIGLRPAARSGAALVFAGCGESDHDSRVEDLENQKRSLERDIGTSEDTIAKHIKEIEELEHAIESIRK